MPFRVLVTGSSGFVGSVLTSALAEGGYRVRAASRTSPRTEALPGVEWMQLADLENQVDWGPILEGMDAVVHLAAVAHRSRVDSAQYARANRLATASLAQACLDHRIKHMIFMSSIGAQTGSAADHLVTELDPTHPVTAYDQTKLAAEEEIRKSGVPFMILRPVIVYGPGAKANIALMMRIARLPLPLPFGAFTNQRSLLSIDNLVQAVIFCLKKPETFEPNVHRVRQGAGHIGENVCHIARSGWPKCAAHFHPAMGGQGGHESARTSVVMGSNRQRTCSKFGCASGTRLGPAYRDPIRFAGDDDQE